MDVTLPDGKVIAGVPDGTTKEQLLSKLLKVGHPSAQALLEKVSTENTLKDMSGIGKFNAGMGGAFKRIGQGAKQMVGMDTDYQAEKGPADALNKTGAGLAGNIAGNVAAFAPAAVVPGANTVAGAGAIGSLVAALQPTDTTGERLKNMATGGALGAGVQAVARYPTEICEGANDVVKGVWRGLKATVEPLYQGGREQILARALRDASQGNQDVPARLAAARELVPGSAPTAAEVAGSPGIAALQRTASQVNPEAYGTRAVQQNEARVAELQDLAGTSGRRATMTDIRDSGAKEMYDAARALGIDQSLLTSGRKGEITKLLKTPAIQDAIEQAKTLAANEMKNVKNPAGSITGLDYVKRALDDQIGKADGNEKRVLVALKDRLLTTIDTLSPAYATARTSFAEMSRPLSQMNVAQEVADRSINKLTGAVQPAAYARALTDDTAASVTGMRNATLDSVMEPQQLNRLIALREDLARSVAARDMGRGPGSDTFQKLSMSNLMQRSGLPDTAMRVPFVGRAMNWAYENADNRMRQQLAEALLNPQEAGRLLSKAPPVPMSATTPPQIGDRAALLARSLALPAIPQMVNQ